MNAVCCRGSWVMWVLLNGWLSLPVAFGADVMGVDLQKLASDVSQEQEIVEAVCRTLAQQGIVQPPSANDESGKKDVWRPGYYQSLRSSVSRWGFITISVFSARTIREVRVNMQGTRSRLPPPASFSHDWDVVLVTDEQMEMRAGALGVSVGGPMDDDARKKFCAALYRAAMENPTARARMEVASPKLAPGLVEHCREGNGYLDFRTNKEAVIKAAASKALEVTGYWNPKTRPVFYIGSLAFLAGLAWGAVRLWRLGARWWKRRRSGANGRRLT